MWQCVKKGPRVFRGNVKCIDEGRELVVAIYSENLESVQKYVDKDREFVDSMCT